jgi:hypothetical protein
MKGVQTPTRSLTFQTVDLYIIIANDSGYCGSLTSVHVLQLEIRFPQFRNLKIGQCSCKCTHMFHYLLELSYRCIKYKETRYDFAINA